MAIKTSTGLRNYMLGAAASKGSFRDAFNGTSEIRIFSGAAPASADDAATGTLLVIIQKDGSGLTPAPLSFADASSGTIQKALETWDGKIDQSGTAGYYRLVDVADDNSESASAMRVQGTVTGVDGSGDLILSSTILTATQTQKIDYYSITFPSVEAA